MHDGIAAESDVARNEAGTDAVVEHVVAQIIAACDSDTDSDALIARLQQLAAAIQRTSTRSTGLTSGRGSVVALRRACARTTTSAIRCWLPWSNTSLGTSAPAIPH